MSSSISALASKGFSVFQKIGGEIADVVDENVNKVKFAVAGVFDSKEISDVKHRLRDIINQIDTTDLGNRGNSQSYETLQAELKTFIDRMCSPDSTEDPLYILESLAHLLPQKILEQALKDVNDVDGLQSALKKAQESIQTAKTYLELTGEQPLSEKMSNFIRNVIDDVNNVIRMILSAFGLIGLLTPNDGEDDHFKMHKIESLIPLLAALAAILAPTLSSSAAAGMVVGGILLTLVVLTVIYTKILRPAPSHLSHAENWTKLAKDSKQYSVSGRSSQMNDMAAALIARTPVLITGKTGVGKTEMVKGFVHDVHHTNKYPQLKGKTFFYINTTNITGQHLREHVDPLEKINTFLRNGNYRDEVVLIFDEIHNAYTQENAKAGERLKTYLRGGGENFPYVIGLTTEEDYQKEMATDQATADRFKAGHIKLDNTNQVETLTILNEHLIRFPKNIIAYDESLLYLIQQTAQHFPNDTQPYGAINILERCINSIGIHQKSQNQIDLEKKKTLLQCYHVMKGATYGSKNLVEKNDTLEKDIKNIYAMENDTALTGEVAALQTEVDKENAKLEKMDRLLNDLREVKQRAFKSVIALEGVVEDQINSRSNRNLNTYLLAEKFFKPSLINQIETKAKEKDVRVKIELTTEIIDEAIKAEGIRREQEAIKKKEAAEKQVQEQMELLKKLDAQLHQHSHSSHK